MQLLTARALVLGAALVICFTAALGFSGLLRHENIGLGYLPRSGIFFLLLYPPLNHALGKISPKLRLSRGELLFLFCMLLCTGSIPGQEFGIHFYLNLLAFVYYSVPGSQFADSFLPHIKPWYLPATSYSDAIIRYAYDGLPPGAGVPWEGWLVPLMVWTPYFVVMYWVFLTGAALLARRWEDEERLLFPLAQVPMEMVGKENETLPALLKNKLMWAAFLVSCALWSLRGIHHYYPSFPDLNLQRTTGPLFPSGPATVFNNMPIEFRPDMIGIAYLLSLDVSLSFWLFYLIRRFEQMFMMARGYNISFWDWFTFQNLGAYIVLALALLWGARRYFKQLVKDAFAITPKHPNTQTPKHPNTQTPKHPNTNPPLSTKLAFWGFFGGIAFVLGWYALMGMDVKWGALLFGSFLLGMVVVCRIVCEAGILIYTLPLSPPGTLSGIFFDTFGIKRIGKKNAVLMLMSSWCEIRSTANAVMPCFLYSYKLGSLAALNRRHLTSAIFFAVVLAFLTTHVANLWVIYHQSVAKLSDWGQRAGFNTVNWLHTKLQSPRTLQTQDWKAMGLGGAVALVLLILRLSLLRFPLHPLGWVIIQGWPIDRYWFSIFLGWLWRTMTMKFLGYHGWYALRPIAYGFIIGTSFILSVWAIIHYWYPAPPVMLE